MARDNTKPFTFTMVEGFDYIIEEGGNTSTNLRKIAWGSDDPNKAKLDLRKWSYQNNEEKAMKGITLTDAGADELTCTLAELGYGDTDRLQKALNKRKGIITEDDNKNDQYNDEDDSEEYYDAKELLG